MQDSCPTCGQNLWGEKTFEGFMAKMLILAISASRDQTVSWRKKVDNKDSVVVDEFVRRALTQEDFLKVGSAQQYARLGDLKHWGLLEQRHEWWHQGLYTVSDKALMFVQGQVMVPRIVKVHKGRVLEEGTEEITFASAYKGAWNDIPGWIKDWRTPANPQMQLL